ncbi:MAG: DUF3891 family protein [Defluviicoccus sp.]|nr:DUF3891 family protein [Defluviicoccus sp.]
MMISGHMDSRLVLVLQTDHSRVAGLLAAHWGNAEFAEPAPYESMVLAAEEHDAGWWEWEIRPTLTDEGYPMDYIGSVKTLGSVWLDFFRHGIERVAERDAYAGLMILMHAEGLCTRGKGLISHMPDFSAIPEVRDALDRWEARREELVDELRRSSAYRDFATEGALWRNFKLMEVFDQMAQFICNRYPFDSEARRNGPANTIGHVPVGAGRDDVTLTVDVLDGERARVDPYPFDRSPLRIQIPARLVPDRAYESQKAFLREFHKAERRVIDYSLLAG